ncbi:MAG: DUF6498-containing protein [Gammaproteobacteria bacterium]|nr:DUF6498-containing protein [Gammaproteobacteria bacterium]
MGKRWPYKSPSKVAGTPAKQSSDLRQLSDLSGRAKLSIAALILSNLVPLIGVLYFDWDHRLVIALFWIENLIIGAFNILKMTGAMVVGKKVDLFTPVFFLFHYGLFCTVHGAILWELLELGEVPKVEQLFGFDTSGFIGLVADGVGVFYGFVDLYSPVIWLGIVSIVLSKTVSFMENFILKGEILSTTPKDLMGKPYGKIVAMHIGVILGAFAIQKFGSSVWILVVIIGFKMLVDILTHLNDHKAGELETIQS